MVDAFAARVATLAAARLRERARCVDAFEALGYEPTCMPRVTAARQATGIESPFEALRACKERGIPLPPPCGHCPQELFHDATEYDVLYGGAAGGGKTKALVMDFVRAAVRYPGLRALIIRRTFDELAESVIPELHAIGYAEQLGGRYDKTRHDLNFANGSAVRLRYLENLDDATRRQGGGYQYLGVEERTLLAPGVVDFLATRLRTANPRIPVIGVRSTCNPGGASHSEVKTRYIVATGHGQRVITDLRGRTVRFIPARVDDNPHINPEYISDLEGIPDPQLRKALRDGDWDTFAGQVFSEWRYDRHVLEPRQLPAEWRRYAGIDFGYRAPFACLWIAVDPDGRAWVYRELAGTQVGESDQAKRILEAESGGADGDVDRYADPRMWAKTGEHESVAEAYIRAGAWIEAANNDRLSGWQRVHSYLAEAPACTYHREMGWKTCPLIHVFSTCVDLIRTLPALPYDRHKVEDVDTTADDHWGDALRYVLMSIGSGPRAVMPSDEAVARVQGDDFKHRPFGPFALPNELDAPWHRGH